MFLRAIGIPTNMFTVMFTIGRLPGWIAQWKESMVDNPRWKLCRPRQIYTGPTKTEYTLIDARWKRFRLTFDTRNPAADGRIFCMVRKEKRLFFLG